MAKPNEIAPRDGAGESVPARVDPLVAEMRAAAERAKTAGPDEAAAILEDALAMKRALQDEKDAKKVAARLLASSEAYAWAARRMGELLPAGQSGRRTDLQPGSAPEQVPLAKTTISRYRQLAAIPASAFEAALARAREACEPITQSALLKLAPTKSREGADPDARQKKLTRQRARALVDGVAAIDACEAELLRIVDLLGNQLCDPLIEAVRAVDAARAALLRDERCAPALKKGPTPPANSPLVAWDRRQAELAEADGDQAAIEAGDDFDPSVDPTPIGEFPAICPDCNGDSPLPGRPACARCESTGQLLDGKPYPSGDA